MKSWTTTEDIRNRLEREWNSGKLLLAALCDIVPEAHAGATPFPVRVPVRGPGPSEISAKFPETRAWIDALMLGERRGGYQLEWRTANHRLLGTNELPVAASFSTTTDALRAIGKNQEVAQCRDLANETVERIPRLRPWLARRPLRLIEYKKEWRALLTVVEWMIAHPRPGIYIREMSAVGIHTKFVEKNRGMLAELLDEALPEEAVDRSCKPINQFERRYGFREKPRLVRFRPLDPDLAVPISSLHPREVAQRVIPEVGFSDMTVTSEDFSRLDFSPSRVFLIENEINFLAFPQASNSIAIFGSGYGFDNLRNAAWLRSTSIHYWGDIDTHGFAILDQLRSDFPETLSLLMDAQTLLEHRPFWQQEPSPTDRDLSRLTDEEFALYDDLRHDAYGRRVRLEQELISFSYVTKALSEL